MLRTGRASLLVLNSSADPIAASRRVAGLGVHLAMVARMEELVRVMQGGAAVAVVLCPPLRTAEPFAVAVALRRRAPEMPVAILLGRSRLHGGAPRVLWLAERAIPGAVASAVTELAGLECSDEIELSLDAEMVDVADILAGSPSGWTTQPSEVF